MGGGKREFKRQARTRGGGGGGSDDRGIVRGRSKVKQSFMLFLYLVHDEKSCK